MNPFEAFAEDDDDDFQQAPAQNQNKPPKKTHQERKAVKAQKINQAQTTNVNEDVTEHIKENPRNKRYHEIVPPKEVPAKGHYLDRKSGTGRDDRPRKEGGGRGNVGNLRDELNKDIYAKDNEVEEATEEQEVVPEEPEKPTLDEYYRQKGIQLDAPVQREPVKKGPVDADWIKKEKLTVLETKEDKRTREQVQVTRKDLKNQVGMNVEHSELLGFGTQAPQPRREREEEHREHREPREPRDSKG